MANDCSLPAPAHRRLSPSILRYFAASFATPLACALIAFAVLFLVNDVFDDLGDFMGKNVPATVTMTYFLACQPQNFVHVAPISTLLAASFMMMIMGRSNEITALRAAGLSIAACAMPVWVIAALVCGAIFAVNEVVAPRSASLAQKLRTEWTESKKQKERNSIAFHHPVERRDWFFEDFAPTGQSRGAIVRQYRPDGSTAWVLSAARAEHRFDTWIFTAGDVKVYQQNSNNLDGPPTFFAQKLCHFPEIPKNILSHSRNWEQLTIRELYEVLRADIMPTAKTKRLLMVLFWNRATFPLASLVGALFGVAFTIVPGRTGMVRGFAAAVAMLVLFYLISQFTLVLGKNGWLPPFVAGASTNLAFLATGIIAMWKKQ
ncbi:MAG: YjgP/YjgQ family permease [Lentisphaerae bacterium]|mgnify:FL=1|nr:YjgP/YjgQ family permease [Lentisphaerota bacterium]OQC13895.1 MAG: putative permease YjgP/YjgQ family protein [Lentisphaerae bacterium ADurb.Bin082]HQL87124.1 LptF/LptG family permease [Lentisphaeria bacterium]